MLLSAEDLLDTKDRPTSREATVLNTVLRLFLMVLGVRV